MCLAPALLAGPLFARLQRSRKKLARLAVVLLIVTAGMVASMGLSGCGSTRSKQITVAPIGDGHETISPSTPQAVDYGATQAFTVTANAGYTVSNTAGGTCPAGSWSGNTYTTGAVTSNCSVSFSSTIDTYTVTASGDAHVTPSPTRQTVNYNQTGTITLTVASGYIAAIASDTCGGSLSGNTYTTGADTSNCSVSFSGVAVFPATEGPSNVNAVPGNGQVTVSWAAPTNTGTGTISSYTVTYGPTSGTTFTTVGCSTSSTSCMVSGLTNGTAYTFAVTTTTTLGGANETGPATFSSSVTPAAGLVVSPSTLALSSLASSHNARIITLTNNSNSPITLSAVPATELAPAKRTP